MSKVIVFDFDGTLVDSNRIKEEVFHYVFQKREIPFSIFEDITSKKPKADRYDIFSSVVEILRSNSRYDVSADELVNEFSRLAEEKIISCSEVDGAEEMLRQLSSNYSLYINSRTPDQALKKIIAQRGWSNYFKRVYGSSSTKTENLNSIMQIEKITSDRLVMCGDNFDDYEAASDVGCEFIFITHEKNMDLVVDARARVKDWKEYKEVLGV